MGMGTACRRTPRCDDDRTPAIHGLELGLCHGEGVGMAARGRSVTRNSGGRRRLDVRVLDCERVRMAVGAGRSEGFTRRRRSGAGRARTALYQTSGRQNPRQSTKSRPQKVLSRHAKAPFRKWNIFKALFTFALYFTNYIVYI